MVEASNGGQGMTCKDIGTSSLIFPPMKVTGTVKPVTTGQPDATFQLNILGVSGPLPPRVECVLPNGQPWAFDSPGEDSGIVLENIEIAATDGAQVQGEDWELQIHQVGSH